MARTERPHLYVLDGHEPRGVWDVTECRLARGLTQTDVGELIGVTAGTVSSWEAGRIRPDAAHMSALCSAFRVTPGFLYDERRVARNDEPSHLRVVKG